MNTIPMKARKSNSSRVGQPSTGLRPSMRSMQHASKNERRRFIFSIGLFVFTIAGLVIGSSGSVIQEVSAREGFGWGYNRNQPNSRPNQPVNRTSPQPQQSRQTPAKQAPQQNRIAPSAPAQTTPTQSAPAPAPSTTQTQTQATTPARTNTARTAPVQQAPVTTEPVEEVVPVNTAPEIAAMSSAKAITPAEPVTYTSNQISTETRNRLLALAVSATTSGLLIYAMSLFKSSESGAPVRYRIPVREVATR